MKPEHRQALLAILSRLDQATAHTEAALSNQLGTADQFRVEMIRELLAEMQATVEKNLERGAEALSRPIPCGCKARSSYR